MNRAAQFVLHGSGPLRTTPGQQVSVLVVEDNPGDANLIRERLTEAPYARFDVAMVPTLAAARVALPRVRPDVLVIDLQLPDSQGLSTLDALVDQAPAAVKLVVTGSVDSETRTRAIDRGADDILGKEDLRTQLFSRSLLHLMERRRADAAFRELTGMLDATPDAILVVGHDGVVRYVNEVALTLFDRRREDFIGELLGFSVSAGDPVHIEIHARGERRQCELRVAPLQWDQHPAWLATLRDITERRKMEAQVAFADRMVSIGTLAAGVGHEINNPLTSVMANLELALSELEHHREGDPLPADLFEEVHDAYESADRIRAIVRDLKLFSRAEEEQVGPVDIHRVLDSTARMASTEIRHRARLLKRYGEVPPVMANDARLGQVVLNLLVNAAHAIDAGDHDNNHIELRTAVDDEGWVLIQVKDSGSGMSEDVKRRLFAAFFTTKPVGVGTGLGLAISQRIVTSFGGTITVQSELGDGSCFTVRLPPATQAAAAAPVHPVTRIVPPTRGARILVVDDEPLVTNVVRRIFPVPHEVVVCHSGAHAVGLLEIGEHYDVVLCDVMMPQVTGLELYDILAARGAGLEERMVFITGGAFTPEARARLSTLPNPCLDKPFKIPALRDVVEDIIARSRLPDA